MRAQTINNTTYVAVPEQLSLGCNGCNGCAAQAQHTVCVALGDSCMTDGIIWVIPSSPTSETLRKMRTGGSFATHIAEAYEVADSGNRQKLEAAFGDLFGRFV